MLLSPEPSSTIRSLLSSGLFSTSSVMSALAQKAFSPDPVITIARTTASVSASSSASRSSVNKAVFNAFSDFCPYDMDADFLK